MHQDGLGYVAADWGVEGMTLNGLSIGTVSSQITQAPPAAFLAAGAVAGPSGKYYLRGTVGGTYSTIRLSCADYGAGVTPFQPLSEAERNAVHVLVGLTGTTDYWIGMMKKSPIVAATQGPEEWFYDSGTVLGGLAYRRNWQTVNSVSTVVSTETPYWMNWTSTTLPTNQATPNPCVLARGTAAHQWTAQADGGTRITIYQWAPV